MYNVQDNVQNLQKYALFSQCMAFTSSGKKTNIIIWLFCLVIKKINTVSGNHDLHIGRERENIKHKIDCSHLFSWPLKRTV